MADAAAGQVQRQMRGRRSRRATVAQVEELRSVALALRAHVESADRRAAAAFQLERDRIVLDQLRRMPLEALKNASEGRLRLGPVEDAGLRTVADIRAVGRNRIESISGVGAKTSTQLLAAADRVEEALSKVARVRFDVEERPSQQTDLLKALDAYGAAHQVIDPLQAQIHDLCQVIDAHLTAAKLETQRVRRLLAGQQRKKAARLAFDRLAALVGEEQTVIAVKEMASAREALSQYQNPDEGIWEDFIERSVTYNGLLIEVSGGDTEDEASQGYLPEDIVDTIRSFQLDTSLLRVSLRGYQAFGAKFALVQGRTILGDEMGLGKTIEALAVLSHLRSQGATHFLVVSPASVLANWEREITRHTRIERTWQLHGPGRDQRRKQWVRSGGIALTTFDTLRTMEVPELEIEATIVDEAHYVKNPDALRTQAIRNWLDQSEWALLMSGTPMENRIEEFQTLVDHIQPGLTSSARIPPAIAGPAAFRQSVASVYLRRNQDDVLDELPPKIETAEWLSLEGPAAAAYRRAVAEGNFMTMRRAAFLTEHPNDSPKLARLLELVEEATANDRKVVVFSYFRDVLIRVHTALGPWAVGPLTGGVPAAARQQLIDDFSTKSGPAVLVGQIEAGGIGLNIQAASVVILTEPQWKPSTEDQAIARCHRLGQVRPVEVHRLLTENSVDERMLVVLARKSQLFAEYVRQSAMKDATPYALDITDDESTREVATNAEQERRIIELERRRLRLDE